MQTRKLQIPSSLVITNRFIFILFIIFLVSACGDTRTTQRHKVKYEVTGTASEIEINYASDDGPKHVVMGNKWAQELILITEDPYLSVKNLSQTPESTVTCKITIDGNPKSPVTAKTVATCK